MKLIGLAIVALGFALRLNTLLVVVAAALVSGLLAGMSLGEVVALMGKLFVDNRALTLPVVLMIPVVGILERYGLQERVAELIARTRAATAGRVAWAYQLIRAGSSMVGLNIGNHASLVRPLVAPMAEGAAAAGGRTLSESEREAVRAHAAAAENAGNFFADDIVVAVGALLLVKAFFDTAGVEVTLGDLQAWSLPTALWVAAVGAWRYHRLDRRLRTRVVPPSEPETRR